MSCNTVGNRFHYNVSSVSRLFSVKILQLAHILVSQTVLGSDCITSQLLNKNFSEFFLSGQSRELQYLMLKKEKSVTLMSACAAKTLMNALLTRSKSPEVFFTLTSQHQKKKISISSHSLPRESNAEQSLCHIKCYQCVYLL